MWSGTRIMTMSAALAASRGSHHFQAGGFRLGPRLAAGVQADHHVHAGIAQVQRVGMALAAVADDGDCAAFQDVQDFRLFRNNVLPC